MAENSLFWDGTSTGDAGPYSGDNFSDFIRKVFINDRTQQGVIEGYLGELASSGVTSPITVSTGAAMVDGKFYENDSNRFLSFTTPSSNTRIDRIILRKDFSAQTVRLTTLTGTEGSGTPPTVTQTDGTTWEIPIYQVSITTGGIITLIDERSFLYTANSSVWRADNDGPGSGLDADTLDGAQLSTDQTMAGDSDFAVPTEKATKRFVEEKYVRPQIWRYNTSITYPGTSGYGTRMSFNSTYRNDGGSIISWNGTNEYLQAQVEGLYLASINIRAYNDSGFDKRIIVTLLKNGTDVVGEIDVQTIGGGSSVTISGQLSVPVYLAASDYLQAYVKQNASGDFTRVAAATSTEPAYNSFSLTRL